MEQQQAKGEKAEPSRLDVAALMAQQLGHVVWYEPGPPGKPGRIQLGKMPEA